MVSELSEDEFMLDPEIPDLLVFPPHTDFHDYRLFVSGEIILQDKVRLIGNNVILPSCSGFQNVLKR